MNPVCFYYCQSESGDRVEAVIAEVNNTPWNEQHLYVIVAPDRDLKQKQRSERIVADRIEKAFHVSPFMPMEMHYRMIFSPPSDQLAVVMQDFSGRDKVLDVSMQLARVPLTAGRLNWMLVRYPIISVKIFAAIYYQAIRLWLKKCPAFAHPERVSAEPAPSYNSQTNRRLPAQSASSRSHR